MLVTGLVAAFYRSRPKEGFHYANRKTFVTLQLETYDERRRSADALYETRRLSRKEIQRKLREAGLFGKRNQKSDEDDMDDVFDMDGRSPSLQIKAEPDPKKRNKPHKAHKAKKKKRDDWEEWNL